MNELNKNQIEIMKHTISDPKRNWFGTGYGCQDSTDFEELVKLGLAGSRKAADWMGDEVIYSLTQKGKDYLDQLPKPKVKKITRSQARYQRYTEWSDCFESFLDFCYWDAKNQKQGI